MISVKAQSPQKTAPPVCVEESFPLTVTDTQPVARNYVDCTESNDEEEEEEDQQEEEEKVENGDTKLTKEEEEGKGDTKLMKEEKEGKGDTKLMKEEEEGKGNTKLMKKEVNGTIKESEMSQENKKKEIKVEAHSSSNPPKWEDFFTTESLTDSQNSLNSQQSCCSVPSLTPSKMTSSQTPELFSEDEEEETPANEENFSLTLSASLSNHSSQNQDTEIPDTWILQPEHGDVSTNPLSQEKESNDQIVQSEQEELSESQVSSDFDIPCTPESKKPQPEELSQLYRKLAAGEDTVFRKCF